jgi:hypothetical protein
MKNLFKFVCSNGHELGRGGDSISNAKDITFKVEYITHPKLKNKNLKGGDVLKECPDCNALGVEVIDINLDK